MDSKLVGMMWMTPLSRWSLPWAMSAPEWQRVAWSWLKMSGRGGSLSDPVVAQTAVLAVMVVVEDVVEAKLITVEKRHGIAKVAGETGDGWGVRNRRLVVR